MYKVKVKSSPVKPNERSDPSRAERRALHSAVRAWGAHPLPRAVANRPLWRQVFQATPGEPTYEAVKEALAMGYRHIDTAAYYRNEVLT